MESESEDFDRPGVGVGKFDRPAVGVGKFDRPGVGVFTSPTPKP